MEAFTTIVAGHLPVWLLPAAGSLLAIVILKGLHDHTRYGKYRHTRVVRAVNRLADICLVGVVRASVPVGLLPRPAIARRTRPVRPPAP